MKLEGKVALITGGGRGIGHSISLVLAREGADIAVNYHIDLASAEGTADDVRQIGQKALERLDFAAVRGRRLRLHVGRLHHRARSTYCPGLGDCVQYDNGRDTTSRPFEATVHRRRSSGRGGRRRRDRARR